MTAAAIGNLIMPIPTKSLSDQMIPTKLLPCEVRLSARVSALSPVCAGTRDTLLRRNTLLAAAVAGRHWTGLVHS